MKVKNVHPSGTLVEFTVGRDSKTGEGRTVAIAYGESADVDLKATDPQIVGKHVAGVIELAASAAAKADEAAAAPAVGGTARAR